VKPDEPNSLPNSPRPPKTRPTPPGEPESGQTTGPKTRFGEDFRWFFIGGLKTLLPTLITLWLLFWVWNFLWQNIGRHVIWVIKWLWVTLQEYGLLPYQPAGQIRSILNEGNSYVTNVDGVPTLVWQEPSFGTKLLGVGLSILLVYIVGVFVGNLIGRAAWRLIERGVMRLPLVRAIYPSVKQVTDFLLADRTARGGQFQASRVVAVQARHQGVWSIGLVTGAGYGPLNQAIRGDMVTVFIPSSPTAVAGYVVVAHRDQVVELPLTVEEALRLLISGGVLTPGLGAKPVTTVTGTVVPGPVTGAGSVPPDLPGQPGPAASPEPARI